MKVLIIPEDQALDGYIAQPVIEALFADLELRAQIKVLPEPRLRGASQALDKVMISEIVRENPMEDLFLLIVDRDCDRENNEAKAAARVKEHEGKLLACLARQELEVWMLALHKDGLDVPFSKLREHCDPKEAYAEPFLVQQGNLGPGHGRKRAMRALAGKWRSLYTLCGELADLQREIRDFVARRERA